MEAFLKTYWLELAAGLTTVFVVGWFVLKWIVGRMTRQTLTRMFQDEGEVRELLGEAARVAWASEHDRVFVEINELEESFTVRHRERERELEAQHVTQRQEVAASLQQHRRVSVEIRDQIRAQLQALVVEARKTGIPLQVVVASKKEADLFRETVGPLTVKVSKKGPPQPRAEASTQPGATALERLAGDDEIG